MKFLMLILTLLVPLAVLAGPQVVNVTVKGMVCSFCAQGIEKNFLKQEAVEKINVSLEKHLVSLTLKNDKDLSDEKIKKLLIDSGFSVEGIERVK